MVEFAYLKDPTFHLVGMGKEKTQCLSIQV